MATATAEKNVEAKPRQGGGKNDARRLPLLGRRNGVPQFDFGNAER